MNSNITPIKELKLVPISQVSRFFLLPGNTIILDFEVYHQVDFKRGTATFSITETPAVQGQRFTTSINCILRTEVPYSVRPPYIVIMELCDGNTLVIGSPDIPVYPSSIVTTNETKSLSIQHDFFIHPPTLNENT